MKKKNKILVGVAGVLVLGIIFVSAKSKNIPEYETIEAARKDLVQEVVVTGKVQPAQVVDLAFENSGKIQTLHVKVGDTVKEQDILATLNSSDIQARLRKSGALIQSANAELRQYEAVLLSEKAKLSELKSGARLEEVQIARTNVEKAVTALEDARQNVQTVKAKAVSDLASTYNDVPDVLQSAYTNAQIAFREDINSLFETGTDFDSLTFLTKDSVRKTNIERHRMIIKDEMSVFSSEINNIPSDDFGRDQAIVKTRNHLGKLREFFNSLSVVVDDSSGLSDASENVYRGYVNTAKSTLNTAVTSLSSLEQSLSAQKTTNANAILASETNVNTAQKALVVAQNELSLKQAGPRVEELAAQEARIAQAEANIGAARARVSQASADYQGVQADIEKTLLKSPLNGIVTKVDAKIGEIVSLNTPLISVISEAQFEVEANIPEVDISKLMLGKTARITLDAYGQDAIFGAAVSQIDPAETLVDGVATYIVTLQFVEKDDRIKSGMTANVIILTEERKQSITIPQRALFQKDGLSYVKVLRGESTVEEKEVKLGLRGSGGDVEIISGIAEHDVIILSEKNS